LSERSVLAVKCTEQGGALGLVRGEFPAEPSAVSADLVGVEESESMSNIDEDLVQSFIRNLNENAVKNEIEVVLAPSRDHVKAACEEFDRAEGLIEAALAELFTAYPQNTAEPCVLLKVVALNSLYSTRIPLYSSTTSDVMDMVRHIYQRGDAIDAALAGGVPEIVNQIARPEVTGKKAYQHFSFATKYCSWHRPECYPIWDSRVEAYLLWLQKAWGFAKDFKVEGSWKYSAFLEVITRFRMQYGLDGFSFKQLDKFLYRAGDVLLSRAAPEDQTKVCLILGVARAACILPTILLFRLT
jgi:hypothetical protein